MNALKNEVKCDFNSFQFSIFPEFFSNNSKFPIEKHVFFAKKILLICILQKMTQVFIRKNWVLKLNYLIEKKKKISAEETIIWKKNNYIRRIRWRIKKTSRNKK